MAVTKKIPKTCKKGHQYYKSSTCLSCPVCEQERKPEPGFLSSVAAPARQVLAPEDIARLQQLAAFSEIEILKLHGIGPSTIPILRGALAAAGSAFKRSV